MNVPASMKAITVDGGKGPASALKPELVSRPHAADGQLLIKVRAAGINRPDIFQRLGLYPPPAGASEILGLEVAGEVVQAAGRWQVGDPVCALLDGGGYAEYVVVDPRHALPIPRGLSFAEAAGLPETVFTVYANLFEHGGLRPGEVVLVHGATSGIGVTAIQMATAFGARVIATSRTAAKARTALALGAERSIDTSTEDFVEIVRRAGGADVVLDMVGGEFFRKNLDAINMGGRIVFVAALGGAEATLPIFQLMQKRAVLTGSTMRARSADEKARLAQVVETSVWPWLESGRFRPQVDKTFPLADASQAHAHLESGTHFGKVILLVD